MTAKPETPNVISHGGPGSYVLPADEVAARLEHWLGMCHEYDDDPEQFMRRTKE